MTVVIRYRPCRRPPAPPRRKSPLAPRRCHSVLYRSDDPFPPRVTTLVTMRQFCRDHRRFATRPEVSHTLPRSVERQARCCRRRCVCSRGA